VGSLGSAWTVSPIGELLRLVGAVEYALLSVESMELIVEAFDGLLM
jgi:hypothetical protein